MTRAHHPHRLAGTTPWSDPASYGGPRFIRPAPPELILAAEEADRRLNAAGYRTTTFERHILKREHSRRAGTSPVAPCGRGAFYEAALWTATATLVLGIVLWVVP